MDACPVPIFTFCKTQVYKKHRFVATPFRPKIGVFQLGIFRTKNNDVEQKHNLKSGKSKEKQRDFKEKTRQETKKRENID